MKLTPDQKIALLAKLELISDDQALIENAIENNEDASARNLGEVADKIVDWATQLSELLYEIECQDDDIPTGN